MRLVQAAPRSGHDAVLRFLDDLRAAETASARVFAAWVEACALEGLRGGLRAIADREAAHAELLETRLGELGAPCTAAVAEAVVAAALARYGATAVSDEEKLALVLSRYPDDAAPARALVAVLALLDHDPETRELVRLVADGEQATIGWLRAYRDGLAARRPPAGD